MKINNSLMLLILFTPICYAGIQQGALSIKNTLSQPVSYQFVTQPSGRAPGMNVPAGSMTLRGHGTIQAQQTTQINSGFKLGGVQTWGDTITFTLSRNRSEAHQAIINNLDAYRITTDANNKLILE